MARNSSYTGPITGPVPRMFDHMTPMKYGLCSVFIYIRMDAYRQLAAIDDYDRLAAEREGDRVQLDRPTIDSAAGGSTP